MTAQPCPGVPFHDRLALARQMVARRAPQPPVHLADQLGAAGREVRQIHDHLMSVLPQIEPDRHWRQRMDAEPSDEVRAVLLASLMGCTTICLHLRRGGPRPAIARLSLRRVDCERCVQTLYRPPAGEDDRCDVCGADEVLTFHPFAVRQGPLMLVGDACPSCALTLGIRQEAAS
jgi:hypothetical protein